MYFLRRDSLGGAGFGTSSQEWAELLGSARSEFGQWRKSTSYAGHCTTSLSLPLRTVCEMMSGAEHTPPPWLPHLAQAFR